MSFAKIYMTFINETIYQLSFLSTEKPEHGTPPKPSMDPIGAVGSGNNSATVSASSNSSAVGPGPEGRFRWKIVEPGNTPLIQCSYNHPFGTGTTTVTVICPSGFTVQSGTLGPSQSLTLDNNTPSLQNHGNATCTLIIAGGPSTS